ncbi:MAG TPA: hypothetical protein VF622_08550 [Segetibacter sp.]
MKRIFLFIVNLMSIGFLFLLSGCSRNVHQEGFEFDYYPDKNIYYNVATSNFIYSLDGAKTWDSLHASTKGDPKSLGKRVKVYSTNAEVWKENQTHLEMYEGKRLQLINEDDKNYAAKVDEVSDKRTVTTGGISIRKKPAAASKKKGVAGFFNKLFGKKEKK